MPSVSAGVFHGRDLVWSDAVGLADVEGGDEATPEHQYRVASITKTFVAAATLQLRDDGRLDLEDPLSRHLPEAAHGEATIRRMLSHLTGLQREPPGAVWETLAMPSADELLARLREADQVLPPGEEWHYSNLAYALLGQVVEQASGVPFERYVEERLLQPVGLDHTGWHPERPARGYWIDPYADVAEREPEVEMGGTNAAGGLWSTPSDLVRWGAFLADPDPEVLRPESAAQMPVVQAMVDRDGWTMGHGLGLQLWRRGERVYAGHTGGFPGYISILVWSIVDKVGAAAIANASSWPKVVETGLGLVDAALEGMPPAREPWRAREAPPPEVAAVLGRWWSESNEFVFSWYEGKLQARLAGLPAVLPPAVFEQEEPDVWRTAAGRERGELLRVVRDADGAPVKLYWATYPFTRRPAVTGAPEQPDTPAEA